MQRDDPYGASVGQPLQTIEPTRHAGLHEDEAAARLQHAARLLNGATRVGLAVRDAAADQMVDQHHHQHAVERRIRLGDVERAARSGLGIRRKGLLANLRRQLVEEEIQRHDFADACRVVIAHASVPDVEHPAYASDLLAYVFAQLDVSIDGLEALPVFLEVIQEELPVGCQSVRLDGVGKVDTHEGPLQAIAEMRCSAQNSHASRRQDLLQWVVQVKRRLSSL